LRIVVFTGNPELTTTPWWKGLLRTPGLTAVLLCERTQARDRQAVLRRFRKNIRKHGLIWIPYRAAMAVAMLMRRAFDHSGADSVPVTTIDIARVQSHDLHSRNVLDTVRAFNGDLGVSLGGPLLKRTLFTLPRRGTINLHLGKVPEFRGAPVGFWELMHGTSTIGATIHWVDDHLDTGPVIASAEAPIYDVDNLEEVQARAGELGTRLLRSVLERLSGGDIASSPQPHCVAPANRLPTLRQRVAMWRRRWRVRARARYSIRRAAKTTLMVIALYVYRPLRDVIRSARRRHPVRVFTFHRITHLCRDGMTISPVVFETQLRYLARHHDFIPLGTALSLIRNGQRLKRPAAVLTFDDGYRSVYELAEPVISATGATATCFVCTDLVGTDRRFPHDDGNTVRDHFDVMGWDELSELRSRGWEIESHTASHARLSACTGATLRRELEEPRQVLNLRLQSGGVLAYPFGQPSDFSDDARDAAQRAGYSAVFANDRGDNQPGSASLLLSRIDLGGDHDPLAWRLLGHGVNLAKLRVATSTSRGP
jgi:peptidoglycan/xylan/chitin deacetylase (PgdA/CDA1 family)/folate-dependent phosphoribosylglycinamide formyltransferase PurN